MRILYVATIGGFMPFFKSFIRHLLDEGHEIDIATNMTESPLPDYYKEWGCGVFQISCSRSPFDSGNIAAIKEIKKIVSEKNYDIVHCHTPIAAACTRIACRKARKNGTRVIYTAHGFHFYHGAPLKNWLIFYPIEKICSFWTDMIITINKEDYELAKKKLKSKEIEYVPGVGISTSKFRNTIIDKDRKREEIGVPKNARMLLSVGELNDNKNHQIVIKAIAYLHDEDLHYVVAGQGGKKDYLIDLAKSLGVESHVHFLGYRNDVAELFKCADLYILPSIREGLNVSLMEAMASGLPCIASRIRGNTDMVPAENCFDPLSVEEVANLIRSDNIRNSDFVNSIDTETIKNRMDGIYGK